MDAAAYVRLSAERCPIALGALRYVGKVFRTPQVCSGVRVRLISQDTAAWFDFATIPGYMRDSQKGRLEDTWDICDIWVLEQSLMPVAWAVLGGWFRLISTSAPYGAVFISGTSSHYMRSMHDRVVKGTHDFEITPA